MRDVFPILIFLLLAGIRCSGQENEEINLPSPNPDNVVLSCSSDTLYQGDTLTISMSVPHPKHLSIINPDRIHYYVVWWQLEPKQDDNRVSLLNPKEFTQIETLKIITDQTKASFRYHGSKDNEIVFTKTGEYTVLMVDQLSTDREQPRYTCTVYYQGDG